MELSTLQSKISETYPELKVDLRAGPARYFWVTGFRSGSQSFEAGDDVAVNGPGEVWYGHLGDGIVVTVNNMRFFFMFVNWYARRTRSSFGRPVPAGYTLLEKWTGNDALNLPLVPTDIIERVLVFHYCVRSCSRDPPCARPLTCSCNVKCRVQAFCLDHQQVKCSVPRCNGRNVEHVDVHHKDVNEYLLLDSAAGFEADL